MRYTERVFTLAQITDIHDRFGKKNTLAAYLRALCAIGVEMYDSYVTDGHSEYFGRNGEKLIAPPVHEDLIVAETGDKRGLIKQLQLHAQGKTDYLQMSAGLAASGVQKWTFDTNKLTITYYDKMGRVLLTEHIE
jgi:uncharacterized protein YbcV (DUF1398 family)